MKLYRRIFTLCILGCIAITSCTTDVSTSVNLSLIPGDATMVFEMNGNEILAKSGLNTPDDYSFFNFMRLMSGESVGFLESFLKGSKEAGISAERVLFYVSKLPDFAIYLPVVDRAAFEGWLKKTEAPEPVVEDGFRYISVVDNVSIAWNDNMVIVSNASSREKIAGLFKSKKDGLLATSKDFEEFTKKNADIRVWGKYDFIIDSYKNLMMFGTGYPLSDPYSDELFLGMKDFANLSTHFYINFEDGKITGAASFYPPEEVENLKKKFPVLKESFNSKLTKDMPEQSYLAFNMFINIEEYMKIVRENIEKILSGNYVNEFDIEEKSAELFTFLDSPEFNSVVKALAGDVLVSIHGFNSGIITYPLASISFTVNGEDAFNNILKLMPKDFYKKQDNYYLISVNQTFIPVYFAYKDNKIFVSNDLTVTLAFTEGKQEKTFADNPVSKIMSDKMMFYLNMDFETYPRNVKMLLQNFMGDEYKRFASFVEIYECIYFASDTNLNSEFCLQLKNKNVNALKQIFKNIDKAASSAWMN
jgi:hypothetical protein